jgi:hypothetical protein
MIQQLNLKLWVFSLDWLPFLKPVHVNLSCLMSPARCCIQIWKRYVNLQAIRIYVNFLEHHDHYLAMDCSSTDINFYK